MFVGSKVDYDISNLYIPKDGKGDIDYQKSFNAFLTIIVRDKEGNVIKRYKQKSHSPTANFIGLMLPVSYYNGIQQCIKLTTTSNTTINYGYNCAWITYPNGGENNPDYMQNIIVGSGTQSNTYNAYNLNAPISNGSGAGQLIYSSISVPTSITINGNQAYFIISQSYTNQSGGTINISEVGIVVNLYVGRPGNANNQAGSVLVWYDTLSSPISVGSGQQVIIYYTFSVNA